MPRPVTYLIISVGRSFVFDDSRRVDGMPRPVTYLIISVGRSFVFDDSRRVEGLPRPVTPRGPLAVDEGHFYSHETSSSVGLYRPHYSSRCRRSPDRATGLTAGLRISLYCHRWLEIASQPKFVMMERKAQNTSPTLKQWAGCKPAHNHFSAVLIRLYFVSEAAPG